MIKACDTDLGDPNLWFTPDGYPDSLALCIVDSIYSTTGARYSSVVNVVGRYREYKVAILKPMAPTNLPPPLPNLAAPIPGPPASAIVGRPQRRPAPH